MFSKNIELTGSLSIASGDTPWGYLLSSFIPCGHETWLFGEIPSNGLMNENIIYTRDTFPGHVWLPVLWSSSMLYEVWPSYQYCGILIVLLCHYVYHMNSCVCIHEYSICTPLWKCGDDQMTSLYYANYTNLWQHMWGVHGTWKAGQFRTLINSSKSPCWLKLTLFHIVGI